MSKAITEVPEAGKPERPKVSHYGEAHFGANGVVECAVLEDGRRGYVMSSLRQAVGVKKNIPVPRFEGFLAEIAPNALSGNEKRVPRIEVTMPHGGVGIWTESGILTKIASGVIHSALKGELAPRRRGMIEPCMAIMEALANVGEVGLIDEATGYQYHREPDALQDLFARLISNTAADWQRRFHPAYYSALCRLFGFAYEGRHRPLPPIIGKITEQQVYLTVFPKEIVAEIRARKQSEKLHQWLTAGEGLRMLEKQRDAVTTLAASSVDYRDFEARCAQAFHKPGQQLSMIYPQGKTA